MGFESSGMYAPSGQPFISAGGSAARSAAARFGDVCNVKDFGATGDGTTNDSAAIQAAITAAQLTGKSVFFPASTGYKITTGLTVAAAGAKPIRLVADNPYGAILKGTNITLLTIAKNGTIVENPGFQDTNAVGSASFIGIDINNGGSGVNNWSLRGVRVIGQGQIDDTGMATLVALGKGINLNFALKGSIDGCTIAGFNVGLSVNALSNSNKIAGTKIRVNTKGIDIPSGGADDASLSGNTIEANSIGINCDAACLLGVTNNHFENNLSSRINIQMSAGWLASTGNFYSGALTNKDFNITGGAYKLASRSDVINTGITHNGSGTFYVERAAFGTTSAGTGTVTVS